MAHGNVQRRGVPQAQVVAERFGQESLGAPVELPSRILPIAKVPRVDLPAMGTATVGPLAANRSMVQLMNPTGSNTDLILKRTWVSANAAASIQLSTHDTPLTDLETDTASLYRQEGSSQLQPVGQIRSVLGASVGDRFGSFRVPQDELELFEFDQGDGEHFDGIVISPGRGILMDPGADNVTIRVVLNWLERQTA